MKKIKILVVEPDKKAYVKTINKTIDELYGLVYYPYKKIEIQKKVFLIYSEEATIKKDPVFKRNRKINNIDIYSTFVIVRNGNNIITSLTDNQIQEIKEMLGEV